MIHSVSQAGASLNSEQCTAYVSYYPKTDTLLECYGGPTKSNIANAMNATFQAIM